MYSGAMKFATRCPCTNIYPLSKEISLKLHKSIQNKDLSVFKTTAQILKTTNARVPAKVDRHTNQFPFSINRLPKHAGLNRFNLIYARIPKKSMPSNPLNPPSKLFNARGDYPKEVAL
jgi:hypothetical protein